MYRCVLRHRRKSISGARNSGLMKFSKIFISLSTPVCLILSDWFALCHVPLDQLSHSGVRRQHIHLLLLRLLPPPTHHQGNCCYSFHCSYQPFNAAYSTAAGNKLECFGATGFKESVTEYFVPVLQIYTLVEVYEEPDLTGVIIGGVVGGVVLLAIITAVLIKVGTMPKPITDYTHQTHDHSGNQYFLMMLFLMT